MNSETFSTFLVDVTQMNLAAVSLDKEAVVRSVHLAFVL